MVAGVPGEGVLDGDRTAGMARRRAQIQSGTNLGFLLELPSFCRTATNDQSPLDFERNQSYETNSR